MVDHPLRSRNTGSDLSRSSSAPSRSILLILLLYAALLMVFMSADSPVRVQFPHIDSAWFMMGGKAWFSGMVPYVDFTDSKGPLLWLIYGLAHLIAPNSFSGMLGFEILIYWITFIFLFRSAKLLLHDPGRALLAVFVTSFFFFLPNVHIEFRAEDINHLFNAVLIYIIIKIFIARQPDRQLFFWSGVLLASSLMIKFNFTALQAVPVFFMLVYAVKNDGWKGACTRFVYLLVGFVMMLTPFLVYFFSKGIFIDFIREYFINTLFTVHNIYSAPSPWTTRWAILYFVILFALVAYMPKKLYPSGWFRITVWCWFVATFLMILSGVHEYYLNLLVIFSFFGICSLVALCRRLNLLTSSLLGLVVLACIILTSICYKDGEFHDSEGAFRKQADYDRMTTIFNTYKDSVGRVPTISYINLMDRGEHIDAGLLPGTKYWAHQNGSTEEMHRLNIEDVFQNLPDFVIVDSENSDDITRLTAAGYERVYSYPPLYDPSSTLPPRLLFRRSPSN